MLASTVGKVSFKRCDFSTYRLAALPVSCFDTHKMSGCFEVVAAKSASVDFTWTASSGYAWATRIDYA